MLTTSVPFYFPLATDTCVPHENIKPNRLFEKQS